MDYAHRSLFAYKEQDTFVIKTPIYRHNKLKVVKVTENEIKKFYVGCNNFEVYSYETWIRITQILQERGLNLDTQLPMEMARKCKDKSI